MFTSYKPLTFRRLVLTLILLVSLFFHRPTLLHTLHYVWGGVIEPIFLDSLSNVSFSDTLVSLNHACLSLSSTPMH